jgi:membrane-bound serine protease (ClpP class)
MDPSSYLTLGFVLIGAGFLLLFLELFLFSGGLITAVAIGCIAVGVWLTFTDPVIGLMTLVAVFVALPVAFTLMWLYMARTPMGRRFFLTGPPEDATVAALPINLELERLKGRIGRTLSPLRPAGVVDFDGRRVDTITEGMMVDEGQWVRCIDVRAGKVVVRPVEKPNLGDLETAIFN